MDYDRTAIAKTYDAARELPAAEKRRSLAFFTEHVPLDQVECILDLGCGTGRFSAALAETFEAKVIGIDPSETMLTEARAKYHGQDLTFQRAAAEALPLADRSVDMVFLSMVFHHLPKPELALKECARVLRAGKYLCLRNTTADEIASYPYLAFFPSIEAIIREALPTRQSLSNLFDEAGFALLADRTTRHDIAPDWQAFTDKIALRADSFVARLEEAEFRRGLEALRGYAAQQPARDAVGLNLDQIIVRRR